MIVRTHVEGITPLRSCQQTAGALSEVQEDLGDLGRLKGRQ